MKKYIYLFLGTFTFGLGTMGIVLPVLPTTVFYLLTGFFWCRSSPKLHAKLVSMPLYQKYATPFLEKRMTRAAKQRMFGMMGLVFLLSAVLVDHHLIRILLVIIYVSLVIGISWYLKKRPTAKPEK
ncbi:YbaN family protein [Loigolactobacillus jiayinensis]|uniref:YbaN family protein n=1 Tax=Loigolactobacillus jiayinensis TaxID=2486016 RepID=A0ABW1RJC9_9LACO|nr:YbaN family protein [Loigolactobacillus jiayinensis]